MKEIPVGVIGCGYWGPNLVRNFNENDHTDIRYVCDLDQNNLRKIKLRYPSVIATSDYRDLLRDNDLQLIAVATPVHTHCKFGQEILRAGKHLLIEKPLAASVKEAEKLVNLAAQKGLMLFVDHTFVYTGAVRKMQSFISSGVLGDLFYFDSVRVNLGLFQSDVNVVWDLAAHDVSIMDYIVPDRPHSVSAIGGCHTAQGIEDIAYVTVRFDSSLMAHFHVNWLSPVKIRRIILGGSKKMIVFDDLDPAEKIKIYDKGISLAKADKKVLYQNIIQYRIGDMHAPKIDQTEALKVLVGHLAECLIKKRKPITDGESGVRVVRILEAADKSIRRGGVKVRL